MTAEEEKLLDTFDAQFRLLLYKYDRLKQKNEALRNTISQRDRTIEDLQQSHRILEAKYANLKLAKVISINDEEAKDAKLKISRLVREVDKCIALLNA